MVALVVVWGWLTRGAGQVLLLVCPAAAVAFVAAVLCGTPATWQLALAVTVPGALAIGLASACARVAHGKWPWQD